MIVEFGALSAVHQEIGTATSALRLGCFDLFHVGHSAAIDFAYSQAEVLVIGVASDERVRQLKGPERPITLEHDRINRVDGMEQVDYTFLVPPGRSTLFRAVRDLRPNFFVQQDERARYVRGSVLRLLGTIPVNDPGEKLDSTTDILRRQTEAKGYEATT